jgi:hypothetical protein
MIRRILTTLAFVGIGIAIGFGVKGYFQRPSPNRPTQISKAKSLPEQKRSVLSPTKINPPTSAPAASEEMQRILKELAALRIEPGTNAVNTQRRILSLLERLREGGASSLPLIRQFLSTNENISYGNPNGKGRQNPLVPASLRIGLFDVVSQIGGSEAEKILVESLTNANNAPEIAFLCQRLEEMEPGKYRDLAVTTIQNLLLANNFSNPSERNLLYDILNRLHDTSFMATAQARIIQPDGKLDTGALRYLQQTLKEQSLPLAVQLYNEGRATDPVSKEQLGRMALAYVGVDPKAGELFHATIMDNSLNANQRRNLVEDLNEDGLSDLKNFSSDDLTIISKRLALTESYLKQSYVQQDQTLKDAFQEANKDLKKMLEKAAATKQP